MNFVPQSLNNYVMKTEMYYRKLRFWKERYNNLHSFNADDYVINSSLKKQKERALEKVILFQEKIIEYLSSIHI